MDKKKIMLISGFQILVAGAFVGVVHKSIKLVDLALSRDGFEIFSQAAASAKEVELIKKDEMKEEKEIEFFKKNAPRREFMIRAYDSIRLFGQAYYNKKGAHKWVIIVHGYSGCGDSMLYFARKFYNMGYNVLLPDCRGHGRSEGEYVTMGWHDRLDLLAWINKIVKLDKEAKIVLYGQSMGGAAVMMASGEKLPDNVKCIVEDCGYTSVSDEFSYHLKKQFKLPKFPFYHAAEIACRFVAGFNFKDASAVKQVRKSRIPLLFIHGAKDDFVPSDMVYRLYDAAGAEKDLMIVPGAGHAVSENVDKELYWEKVQKFMGKYI